MDRIRNTSPKKMIEDLKADLRTVTRENENKISNIAKLYVTTKDLKNDTVELNEKVVKAKQDKKELLRDLSTYELNFGRQQCN
jgi:chromosome segregation ATPase